MASNDTAEKKATPPWAEEIPLTCRTCANCKYISNLAYGLHHARRQLEDHIILVERLRGIAANISRENGARIIETLDRMEAKQR